MPRSNTVLTKRYTDSVRVKELNDHREAFGSYPHVAPYSVLMAAMGNYWFPGCFERVEEMCQLVYQAGIECVLYEQPDLCDQPFDAIGVMRNMAYLKAIREGWEYILYLDNDVMVQPELALGLLGYDIKRQGQDIQMNLSRFQVPVVSPIVTYSDGDAHNLIMPTMERNMGLAPANTFVISCVLFNTRVFTPWYAGGFWEDPKGADELYHFQKLYTATGHRPFVDTNHVVVCQNPPHYPLDPVLDARWAAYQARVQDEAKRAAEDEIARKGPKLWTPPQTGLREV